jgi:hypothetical protein
MGMGWVRSMSQSGTSQLRNKTTSDGASIDSELIKVKPCMPMCRTGLMNTLSSTIVNLGEDVLAGCWVKQADELALNNRPTCMNNTCLTTTKLLYAHR